MGERMYRLSAAERDALIVAMRARGETFEEIGKRVGMTRSGVRKALQRIERGDPGVDRRG